MKKIKIFTLVAGIFLLAGCGNKAVDKPTEPMANNNGSMKTETKTDNSGGVISSIKEAMGLGKEMKCTYKMKIADKEVATTAFVNGKNYRTQTEIMGKTQNMLFNEDAMYAWVQNEKQGTKFTKSCMEEMAKNIPAGTTQANNPDPTGEKTFDNAMEVSCIPDNSGDFSVPTGITFTDQCEFLKGMMKNIPAGANIPAGVNIPKLP